MEYILIALRAGIILAFFCSVHMKTASVNEDDVPDTHSMLKSLEMTGSHSCH